MAIGDSIGSVTVDIKTDSAKYEKGLTKARKGLKSFSLDAPRLLKGVSKGFIALGVAATAAGVAITAVAVKTVQQYARFAHEMANVSTLIQKDSVGAIKMLSEEIRELSLEVPQTTSVLTSALYDIVSAGAGVENSMDVLAESSKAAIAGVSDTATAAGLATSTINAMNLEFEDTGRVFDIAFATVRSGVITFEELAGSLGEVLPSAKKLNAGIEEVYGSIAFLTKAGLSASAASISFARALDSLGSKAEQLEGMGVRIFGEEGQYLGIVEVIKQIREQVVGLTTEAKVKIFEEMGFEVRAARAIITMTENLEGFRETMADVTNSAGAAGEAYEKMAKTLVNQWTLLKNSVADLALSIGKHFEGIAGTAVTGMKGLVDDISTIVSEGGSLSNLWIEHHDLVLETFRNIAEAGIELTAGMLKGMGSIIASASKVMWIPIKAGFKIAMLEALEELPNILTPTVLAQKIPLIGPEISAAYDKIWAPVKKKTDEWQEAIWGDAMTVATTTIDAELPNILESLKNIGVQFDESFNKGAESVEALAKSVTKSKTALVAAVSETSTQLEILESNLVDAMAAGASEEVINAIKEAIQGLTSVVETESTKRVTIYQEEIYTVAGAFLESKTLMEMAAKDIDQIIREGYDLRLKVMKDYWSKHLDATITSEVLEIESARNASEKGVYWREQTSLKREDFDKKDGESTSEYTELIEGLANDRVIALIEEHDRTAEVLEASKVSWVEFGEATRGGFNALSESYYNVVDVWRTLTGDQREFHDTWLSDMAEWADRIKDTLQSVITLWKNASTIIAKIAQFLGGDGGGTATAALQAAGALGGGGGVTVGQVGGTVAGGASIFGKIGGGIKAGGAAVGSAGAAAGAAIAPVLPLLGPMALAAGAAYLIDKYHKPPGAMSAEAEEMWLNNIEYQKLLAFKENQRYEHALEREKQMAAIAATIPAPGFGDTRNQALLDIAAATGADLMPTWVRGAEGREALSQTRMEQAARAAIGDFDELYDLIKAGNPYAMEYLNITKQLQSAMGLTTTASAYLSDELSGHSLTTAMDQATTETEKLTAAMIAFVAASKKTAESSLAAGEGRPDVDRQMLAEALWDLLAPGGHERGYF